MYTPVFKNKFNKDLKLSIKRGKSASKIKKIMSSLISGEGLEPRYRDHSLKGEYTDCRECHIEPDWLLIYMIKKDSIIFIRAGTHSDLFQK
jgi:mRNA interferase YafQ